MWIGIKQINMLYFAGCILGYLMKLYCLLIDIFVDNYRYLIKVKFVREFESV